MSAISPKNIASPLLPGLSLPKLRDQVRRLERAHGGPVVREAWNRLGSRRQG